MKTLDEIIDNIQSECSMGSFEYLGIKDCKRAMIEYAKEQIESARMQAIGWAWAEACTQLDNGEDPRQYDQSKLVERAEKQLT